MNDSRKSRFNVIIYDKPQQYSIVIDKMRAVHNDVMQNMQPSQLWILEHEPVYTAGSSISALEIERSSHLPAKIYHIERGGMITYHGPGQMICYLMANVRQLCRGIIDVGGLNNFLTKPIIVALQNYGIQAYLDHNSIGLFTAENKKIASIGLAIRRGVSMHGIAVNINTDMQYFQHISPCGLDSNIMYSVATLLGHEISMLSFKKLVVKHIIEYMCDTHEVHCTYLAN